MSVLPPGGHMLERPQALPPREQRILAPSLVSVVDSDMGATQCVCALAITDVVNLTIYYVPMTRQMMDDLSERLIMALVAPDTTDTERNHN
jgi:hypothetical protein